MPLFERACGPPTQRMDRCPIQCLPCRWGRDLKAALMGKACSESGEAESQESPR